MISFRIITLAGFEEGTSHSMAFYVVSIFLFRSCALDCQDCESEFRNEDFNRRHGAAQLQRSTHRFRNWPISPRKHIMRSASRRNSLDGQGIIIRTWCITRAFPDKRPHIGHTISSPLGGCISTNIHILRRFNLSFLAAVDETQRSKKKQSL